MVTEHNKVLGEISEEIFKNFCKPVRKQQHRNTKVSNQHFLDVPMSSTIIHGSKSITSKCVMDLKEIMKKTKMNLKALPKRRKFTNVLKNYFLQW